MSSSSLCPSKRPQEKPVQCVKVSAEQCAHWEGALARGALLLCVLWWRRECAQHWPALWLPPAARWEPRRDPSTKGSASASAAPKATDSSPLRTEGPTSSCTSRSELCVWPRKAGALVCLHYQTLLTFQTRDWFNLSPLPQQRGVMQMLLAAIDYAVLFLFYYKSVELKTRRWSLNLLE